MTALGTFTRIGSCGAAIVATLAIALAASPSNHIARLRGTWNCSGLTPGSVATERYTRRNHSFVLETTCKPRSERSVPWSRPLRSIARTPQGMALTAAPPGGPTSTFTVSETIHGRAIRIRIVYAFARDGFRRTQQREAGSGWHLDGAGAGLRRPSGEDLGRVALAKSVSARAPEPTPTPSYATLGSNAFRSHDQRPEGDGRRS